MKRSFGVVVTLLAMAGSACLGPTPPNVLATGPAEGTFGILFVGNSLTYYNDMPLMLDALLASSDLAPVSVGSVSLPDYGLQDHWVTRTSRDAVSAGWDVVIMQQGPSATTGRPSLLEYSRLFADEIRAAGGEPALYMVWPAASRDFDFDGVSESYSAAADSVDGWLFPAGEAWRAAWRTDPTLSLYGLDGFHPSTQGSYLAALVMYEQLAEVDVSALPLSTPATLGIFTAPDSVVRVLHDAAAEANRLYARAR